MNIYTLTNTHADSTDSKPTERCSARRTNTVSNIPTVQGHDDNTVFVIYKINVTSL